MSPIAISAIIFLCVFGGALLGMVLRGLLPDPHLTQDSKDVIKLGVGLIGTMAALVIGLMTASAKGSFDTVSGELKHTAINIILVDRALASYGPETAEIRESIRRAVTLRVAMLWPDDGPQPQVQDMKNQPSPIDMIEEKIRGLTPQNDAQRSRQERALQIIGDLAQTRWLVFSQMGESSIPLPFLVVLVIWLTLIFTSYGLFAPRNGTVVIALLCCALSASGAIFLILEMDSPFNGLLKASSAPLRYALAQLAH